MSNSRIRTAAKVRGVRLWQVAEAYGVTGSTFSRMLRHELPEDKQAKILTIIDTITKEGTHAD